MKALILTLTLLITTSVFAAKGRGGGHSITVLNGEEVTLDLFKDYALKNNIKNEINPRVHPLFKIAYQKVDSIMNEIGDEYPGFVQLINHFNDNIVWELSKLPLEKINDSDSIEYTSKLNQACYNDNGKYVRCFSGILEKMNDVNKSALILHEVLLQGLGLHFNRDSLRNIVSGFVLNKNQKFEILKEELNSISPYILQGKIEFKVATGSNLLLELKLHEQKESSGHVKVTGESVKCDLPKNSLKRSSVYAHYDEIKCHAVLLTIDNLRETKNHIASLIESWNEGRVYYFINNSFRYSDIKNNSTIGFKERSLFFIGYVLNNYFDKI